MDILSILLILAYATFLFDLVIFPIPSEASTYQLFFGTDISSTLLKAARRRPALGKLLAYLLPSALGVILFLVPLIAVAWPGLVERLFPFRPLQRIEFRWAGITLVFLGRLLSLTSTFQLRPSRRAGELRRSGCFGFSRNPILLGMYLFYLGNCLLLPSLVLMIGFVPYVLGMHRRILMEEGHLARTLGAVYGEYHARVPRYLLFRTQGRSPNSVEA